MREQVYKDPRPAEQFTRFHERARTRKPDWVYGVVRALTTLYGAIAFRARGVRPDRVPRNGPLILAPNHFSFMDHFFVGMFLRRQVQFMAKSQLFKRPMQWVYTHGGVFPVRRGQDDQEAFVTAEAILARGGCVVMYCEGGGRARESWQSGPGRASAGSRCSPVPRSSRWRSTVPSACATGSGCGSRRSRSTMESPSHSKTNATRAAIASSRWRMRSSPRSGGSTRPSTTAGCGSSSAAALRAASCGRQPHRKRLQLVEERRLDRTPAPPPSPSTG